MPAKNKIGKAVICALVSGIDIYLAVSLELWTKTARAGAVCLFAAVGFALLFLLNASLFCSTDKRMIRHAVLWGLPLAASHVLGCLMRRDGTALASLAALPALLVQIACLTVPAAACVACILRGFPRLHGALYRRGGRQTYRMHWIWIFCTAVIFLCWLPIFLAYYPSVFAYDAEGQLYQVIAHDYSTHHPLLHTLFLGAFFRLGGLLGSYSAGMAVHSVVQMTLMAAAFGYALAYLYRRGVSRYLCGALLAFYALFPANSVLALSTTKDVLFSALVLLYALVVYQMAAGCKVDADRGDSADDVDHGGRTADADTGYPRGVTRACWAAYILLSVFLLLFRNNAVYAWALSAPLVWFGLRTDRSRAGRAFRRRYARASLLALLLFLLCSLTLRTALGAQSGSPREMLSVPLQQMARTRVEAEESLSYEMRRELDKYLPAEWVFAAYHPHLADPVKNRAVVHDDPAGLIRTWLKLGLRHPQIYIDAFLDNSVGCWFLEDESHAQIYGVGTESGFGYLSTDNRTMPAGCEIIEHSYLPGLRAAMERIVSDNIYRKIPVVRILFAPAFYWWMLCMYAAVAVYRREYRLLFPALFPAVYYLTLLLSPAVLVRYMYPFMTTAPVLCCLMSARQTAESGKIYNKS